MLFKSNKKTKKGFTLVELCIIMAIIAILSATLIPAFSGLQDKMRRASALETCSAAFNQIIKNNAVDKKEADVDNSLFISTVGKKSYSFVYNDGKFEYNPEITSKKINSSYFKEHKYPCVVESDATVETGRTTLLWPNSSAVVMSRSYRFAKEAFKNQNIKVGYGDDESSIKLSNLPTADNGITGQLAVSFGTENPIPANAKYFKFFVKGVKGWGNDGRHMVMLQYLGPVDIKADGNTHYFNCYNKEIYASNSSEINGYDEFVVDISESGLNLLGNNRTTIGGYTLTCKSGGELQFYTACFFYDEKGNLIETESFDDGFKIVPQNDFDSHMTVNKNTVIFNESWSTVSNKWNEDAFAIEFTNYLVDVIRMEIKITTSEIPPFEAAFKMGDIILDRNNEAWSEIDGKNVVTESGQTVSHKWTFTSTTLGYLPDALHTIPFRCGGLSGSVTVDEITLYYLDGSVAVLKAI